MGKIFSRPVRSSTATVPLLNDISMNPDTLPSSTTQREISVGPEAAQNGASHNQGLRIDYGLPDSMAGASHLNLSPSNTEFTRTEQDPSTFLENGGSVTSPTIHTRGVSNSQFRLIDAFYEAS